MDDVTSTGALREAAAPAGLSGYIRGFDGMRAFAVLLVLVAHAGYESKIPGGLGVSIFFTISGFLITNLLMGELERTGTIDLRMFYARRVLRLYPELAAMWAVTLASSLYFHWQGTFVEKLAGLFYLMNYYVVFGQHAAEGRGYPWGHLWSLAVEEHFYLIFPALLLAASRKRWLVGVLAALVVLPLLWRWFAYSNIDLKWYTYVTTECRIDSIAWGCCAAFALRWWARRHGDLASAPFVKPYALAAGVAALLVSLALRGDEFRWTLRFSLQGAALFLIIVNLLYDPRWRRVIDLLEWRPVRYIGRISYGLYLYHMLVIATLAVWHPVGGVPFLIASLIASVIVASMSYHFLEVPLKPIRRRLGSHVR